MALKSTVYKAELQIADLDRQYYQTHTLTLAMHPSETEERLMLRVLAFALFAHDDLQFTRGICADDEPDLWQKDLDGTIVRWIDLGLPDEKRLRRACHRARQAVIIAYGGNAATLWWKKIADEAIQHNNLQVINITRQDASQLAQLAERNMSLSVTLQENEILFATGNKQAVVQRENWL